jgi:hypothetical protein
MAFVTEKASEQDIEQYGLRAINKTYSKGEEFDWTIDRERDIYLRKMRFHWHDPSRSDFIFYWQQHLLPIKIRSVEYMGSPGKALNQTWAVVPLYGSDVFWLPRDLEDFRVQITMNLKQALTAYGTHGSRGAYSEYIARFQF